MISLYNADLMLDCQRLLKLEPGLRHLLLHRIEATLAQDLGNLSHILVIQPGDTEADILQEACISPLRNTLLDENLRFGSPGWVPQFDAIDWSDDGGWTVTTCIADSGYAVIMMIPDDEGIDADLRALCEQYAPH
jgi:hypothetical protein